jgi:hypothetical protein
MQECGWVWEAGKHYNGRKRAGSRIMGCAKARMAFMGRGYGKRDNGYGECGLGLNNYG